MRRGLRRASFASYKERDVAYRAAKLMESGAIDEYLAKRERESNSE